MNPVGQAEITDAQSEYEKLYEEEHARFVASHKEDISVASVEGIDSKLRRYIGYMTRKWLRRSVIQAISKP